MGKLEKKEKEISIINFSDKGKESSLQMHNNCFYF